MICGPYHISYDIAYGMAIWYRLYGMDYLIQSIKFILGVASLNGLLYVVGGDDGSSNLHSVEYYNPSSDTWSLISTTMEIGRR